MSGERAEHTYYTLIHYNKLEKGGHFAAWEQPKLIKEEVRACLRPLRLVLFDMIWLNDSSSRRAFVNEALL